MKVAEEFRDWHLMSDTPSGLTLGVNCLSGDFYLCDENKGAITEVDISSSELIELRNVIEEMENKQWVVSVDLNLDIHNPAVAFRQWDVERDGKRSSENEVLYSIEFTRLMGGETHN